MSARQPFVPQQRPPTRSNPPSGNLDVKATLDDTLRPNGLLSDPAGAVGDKQLSFNTQSRVNSSVSDMSSLVNKPLNLAGFAKKKVALPFGKSRKSFEDNVARTASPRPNVTQPSPRIAAPSPFFSTNSGFAPISSFRNAHVSSPSTLHSSPSGGEFNTNQAHTPANPPGLDDRNNCDKFSQPLGTHIRPTASRPSLEKIQELAEEDGPADQYSGHDLPRDDIDSYHSSSSPMLEEHQPGASYNNAGANSDNKPPLHRVQKRFSRAEELETADYGNPSKKFKADVSSMDEQQTAYYVRGSSPQYERGRQEHAPEPVQMQVHASAEQRTSGPVYAPSVVPRSTNEGSALHRLLGQDLDTYVDTHVDAYDQAKKKWAECSNEEWKAGADELIEKFTKMIDFVKEHMTTKLKLYAALDTTIVAHREELVRRDDALKNAREALVRDGGNVVSGRAAISGGSETGISSMNAS